MKNSRRRAERRRRIAVITAVLIAVAMVLMSTVMVGIGSAAADEREEAVAQQRESQKRINDLNSSIESIDSELKALFLAMEQTKIDVGVAQEQLVVAREALAAAERHLQQVTDELQDAEALQAELLSSIEKGKKREGELSSAVGSMAREMYRGDRVSPLQIVVQTEDMGEISTRAAAATALSRAQSRALDDVRSGLVVTENQSLKQKAVTDRIADLKQKAEEAYTAAEQAKADVENRVASLEALQAEQAAAQESWEARKGDAQAQLQSANKELEDAAARIAAIDLKRERERLAAQEAERKAQEEARQAAARSSGASSSSPSPSQPSSPPPATSSGSLLGYPFNSTQRITSHFGYRMHPVFGIPLLHNGTDWGAACGTTQVATRAGTVSAVGYTSLAGNYLQINHGVVNGRHYITNYSHAQRILVSVGQRVSAGTPVALTGTTGASTGCHLHFTLFQDGTPVNPLPFM